MKLNYGSLFFNMNLAIGGGTPAWGTELGQGDGYRFKDELEIKEIITSLVYTNIGGASWSNIYCPLGKGGSNSDDYELKLASVYDKVYVNGDLLKGQRFLLLIVKLLRGDNHVGRCTLKYNPKIKLHNEEINQNCYNAIAQHLGVDVENGNSVGAWFVSDIILKNQDELHFICHVVNPNEEVIYPDTKSRKDIFKSFEDAEEHKRISSIQNTQKVYATSPLQQIFYGAPGTGKSHAVKERTEGETVIRTTFHPDSDYSTFVGAYKPTMTDEERILTKEELMVRLTEMKNDGRVRPVHRFAAKYSKSLIVLDNRERKDIVTGCGFTENTDQEVMKGIEVGQYLKAEYKIGQKIAYSFVAQAFLQAYVAAWRRRVSDAEDRAVYLVIEEINRGNCAQIFGDLFQLLDRDGSGFSEYPVAADADMRKYLGKELAGLSGDDLQGVLPDDIIGKVFAGELLLLPDNMYIWATMNTSDQSLFPIDSAFKRRWDWTYVPIENADKGWKIAVGSERYDWWDFLQKINDKIGTTTSSEDKKLGYFFCKARDGMISADTFVSKVVFYLWNDVFKDYDPDESIFSDGEQGILTFNRFYEGFGKVSDTAVRMMLTNLGVAEESGEKNTDDVQAEVAAETE